MKRSIYSQNSLLRISLLSALTLTASFTTHAQDKPVAGGVLTVALGSDTPIIDPSITAYPPSAGGHSLCRYAWDVVNRKRSAGSNGSAGEHQYRQHHTRAGCR